MDKLTTGFANRLRRPRYNDVSARPVLREIAAYVKESLTNFPPSEIFPLKDFFNGGCQAPTARIDDLRDAYEKAVKSKEELLTLQAKQAETREESLKTEHQATLDRVQLMANAAFEAQLANSQNPQPNNDTHIV